MKNFLAFSTLIVALSCSSAQAQQFYLSDDANDPFAGVDLVLDLNEVSSLYVFVVNDNPSAGAGLLSALSYNIGSSDAAVAEGISHVFEDDANRWFFSNPGTPGDLLVGASAARNTILGGTGILNDVTTLVGTLDVQGTAVGVTNTSLTIGGQGVTVDGNSANANPSFFGDGTITVQNAIPEPSTGLIALAAVGFGLIRRRRA